MVYVANHGEEALEFLRRTEHWTSNAAGEATGVHSDVPALVKLSVILMDIEMPVMDGLACARQIRAFQESGQVKGHIPIMAVSANARSEQVQQSQDAGMDDAISKPFRIPELLSKLDALVHGGGPVQVLSSTTKLAEQTE